MRLVHTQHQAVWNYAYRRWETEEFEPPIGGFAKNVRWPADPITQPIEIVWVVNPIDPEEPE